MGRALRPIATAGEQMLAYIDPGAGSLVIQAIIAGLVSVPFFFRSRIASVVGRFRRSQNEQDVKDSPENP
jgi:hypothetical protein